MRRFLVTAAPLVALAACATGGPPPRMELSATLTGQQSVPGPGDQDGTGTFRARVDSDNGQVCWELNARGIDPATSAVIHRGDAGMAGTPVVPLTAPDASGRSEGCVAVARDLAAEMITRPHGFHVNVSNGGFAQSAIRGQLRGDPRRGQFRSRSGN